MWLEKLDERRKAGAAVAELLKRKPEADANRRAVARGRAAAGNLDVQDQSAKARAGAAAAAESLKRAAAQLERAQAQCGAAEKALKAEKERLPEHDEWKARIAKLKQAQAKAEELTRLEATAAEAAKRHTGMR